MAGWCASELARLVGIPIPTVSAWIREGLVTPDHFGRGRAGHVIGAPGLMELLTVAELKDAGFSTQTIRHAVGNLRDLTGHDRPLARLTLVVEGNDIAWRDIADLEGRSFSALRRPGQRLMVFPVGETHARLIAQLETEITTVGVAPR